MSESRFFNEEYNGPPPQNRNFNSGDWFSFIATESETEAGSLIVRKNLVGFCETNTPVGKNGVAYRRGARTFQKSDPAVAFAQGELVFCKADGKALRATATGAVFIGYVHFDSDAGNAEVEVILEPNLKPTNAVANVTPSP